MNLSFRVNGREVVLDVPPMKRLLDVLREDLGLTGSKEGCGEGECGACSVLLDGDLVNACLVPAVQVDGAEVRTVEGLADGETLAVLQQAFVEKHAVQCGSCTPGMLMAAQYYLEAGGRLAGEGAREALAGNLCRCTGYSPIVDAVELAEARLLSARAREEKRKTAGATKAGTKKATAKKKAGAKKTKAAPKKSAKKSAPAKKKTGAKAKKRAVAVKRTAAEKPVRRRTYAKKVVARAARRPARKSAKGRGTRSRS